MATVLLAVLKIPTDLPTDLGLLTDSLEGSLKAIHPVAMMTTMDLGELHMDNLEGTMTMTTVVQATANLKRRIMMTMIISPTSNLIAKMNMKACSF